MLNPFVISVAFAAFLVAGIVKGVIGLGLPTVGIGLLSLAMTPAEAAVLLVVPTVVTNVWQLAFGPGLRPLIKRLWLLLAATCIVTFLSAGLLASDPTSRATAWLGGALVIYAIVGLCAVQITVPPRTEPWLGPLAGATTGLIAGATGVFSIPGVIYLNGLGLQRDELIQALGLTFTFADAGARGRSLARRRLSLLDRRRIDTCARPRAVRHGAWTMDPGAHQRGHVPHLLFRRLAAAGCASGAANADLSIGLGSTC